MRKLYPGTSKEEIEDFIAYGDPDMPYQPEKYAGRTKPTPQEFVDMLYSKDEEVGLFNPELAETKQLIIRNFEDKYSVAKMKPEQLRILSTVNERTVKRFQSYGQYNPTTITEFFIATRCQPRDREDPIRVEFEKFVEEGGNLEAARLSLAQARLTQMKMPEYYQKRVEDAKVLMEKEEQEGTVSEETQRGYAAEKYLCERLTKMNPDLLLKIDQYYENAQKTSSPHDELFDHTKIVLSSQRKLDEMQDRPENEEKRKLLEKTIKSSVEMVREYMGKLDPAMVEVVARERQELEVVLGKQKAYDLDKPFDEEQVKNSDDYQAAVLIQQEAQKLIEKQKNEENE